MNYDKDHKVLLVKLDTAIRKYLAEENISLKVNKIKPPPITRWLIYFYNFLIINFTNPLGKKQYL